MRTSLAGSLLVAVAIAAASPLAQQPAPAPAPAAAKPDEKKEEEKPKEPKWDVAAELGPTSKIAFDTCEGTWMNVDVSPDGTRSRLRSARRHLHHADRRQRRAPRRGSRAGPPSTCSRASAPTASASRSRAIVTGLWNIWTMDAEGKNAKQVSREKRWFINSPTWAPDGELHLSPGGTSSRSARSAPARSGCITAAGVRRPAGHREARLPEGRRRARVSPDGRYLYYSKDVTPGQTFEYNKDPERHDLRDHPPRSDDGPRAARCQRAGRSVTPQVSPDGQVARLRPPRRLGSQLFVRDLETGRDRRGFGDVDKDLQEAWAIHRPLPAVRVDARRQTIVIWGEGKIWRVDVAAGGARGGRSRSRRGRTDPNDAVRFPQKVHTDEFPVRMLRDVVVVARRQERRLQRARAPLSSRLCRRGQPKRLTSAVAIRVLPVLLAPTASGSSTRRGRDAERGRVRVVQPDGIGRPRRGHDARALRRAVVLAGRPDDRVSARRRRRHARPLLRRRAPASSSCRSRAASPCSCARAAVTRSSTTPARASIFRDVAQREVTSC